MCHGYNMEVCDMLFILCETNLLYCNLSILIVLIYSYVCTMLMLQQYVYFIWTETSVCLIGEVCL